MPARRPPSPHHDALVATVWRISDDPSAAVDCPVCGAPGLAFDNRSTPPMALWYALNCGRCGLDEIVYIPLGNPYQPG